TSTRVHDEHAAGAAAELRGVAAAFHINGANGIGADAQLKEAGGRLADIEAIEHILRLIAGGAGDVDLRAGELRARLHHTGDEAQDLANVTRGGVRNVDEVAADQRLGARGALRIDGGSHVRDVDDLADRLLVGDGDFNGGAGRQVQLLH